MGKDPLWLNSDTKNLMATEQHPEIVPMQLEFNSGGREKLTHYLFRYPAKFHPPVASTLIDQFSSPGDWILDPFCGSGTVLVEASTRGRNSLGLDCDPIAVFVSRVKSHRFDVDKLKSSANKILDKLTTKERAVEEYEERKWQDMTEEEYRAEIEANGLWVPEIPKLHHWFRRYVTVDMARILGAILSEDCPETHRDFLRLCFCSIIRACSNADPIPVSGLEVTAYMKEKEVRGRLINPFERFRHTLTRSLNAAEDFSAARAPGTRTVARQCDATKLANKVRRTIDCVITSPPYYTAVDYYRRHQLEMYWLGFTQTQEERQKLIPQYIGRRGVSSQHPTLKEEVSFGPLGTEWVARLEKENSGQVSSFKHYVLSMGKVFQELSRVLNKSGKVVVVIGNSKVKGAEMPTADLVVEIAGTTTRLVDRSWYHIKNKYMSYSRNNGADIDTEHVLVFQPKA